MVVENKKLVDEVDKYLKCKIERREEEKWGVKK